MTNISKLRSGVICFPLEQLLVWSYSSILEFLYDNALDCGEVLEVVSTELRDRSIMMEYDICMSSNPESRQSIAKTRITKPETILRDGDSKDSHYI